MDLYTEAQDGTLINSGLEKYLRSSSIDDENPTTGFTPLTIAVKGGHSNVVILLLRGKANVNKKTRDGRTPLYLAANARNNRPRLVQLLLEYNARVDESSGEWENETPLMVAITQARDPEVIRLLVDARASLTKKNDRGETAQVLAGQSSNPAIRNAILPKDQQNQGRFELTSLIISFVLFILAYVNSGYVEDIIKGAVSSLYGIVGSAHPDSTIAEAGRPSEVVDI